MSPAVPDLLMSRPSFRGCSSRTPVLRWSCVAFFTKMTGFTDDLAAVGKKVDNEDVMSYILAGLDAVFNPFIENVCGRSVLPSLGDFYT